MEIGKLIRFQEERFFEGAVQLRWLQTQEEKALQAAQAFVFHGPRYHGASSAENEGIQGGYRLKDSASFVRDLLKSIDAGRRGEETNPYWMVVAGYGSGKSHLALTCAALLGRDARVAESILAHIEKADMAIGAEVREQYTQLTKPVLVLSLDGMSGFHLGNALNQAVLAQLQHFGVDSSAIRDLSPRFQTAEQFVERNFEYRCDSFSRHLPGLDSREIRARLRNNDEDVYTAVDAIYVDANGSPIPVVGQESAQELINTLCEVYCGPDGQFSSIVILFDEFGRYLEYAAEKPRLAGDAALQQVFQGVQDNSGKVRFVGFIQYELKTYLKRFGSADLRQLQRYITRFDAAQKWYLSTNLETIFAHMIGKNEAELNMIWRHAQADIHWQTTWRYLSQSIPGFHRFPVWSEVEQFSRVIGQGCWPLHPFATWFLTRQSDVVQSRSALTFIKDVIEHAAGEAALINGRLRQISAAELVLKSMLSELIAAERETGGTSAETLQLLLAKFQAHLNAEQQRVLASVAILAKMRIGKQNQETMDRLIGEVAALDLEDVNTALRVLGQELGALEWNRDLGQYELIADAASRGQFQQWLRKKQAAISADAVRDLFIRRAAKDSELGNVESDFGHHHDIRTKEWLFDAQYAHVHTIENAIKRAFQEWREATDPGEAKGRLVYLYLHANDDVPTVQAKVQTCLRDELGRLGLDKASIWVIGIVDRRGSIAEHIARLEIFEESLPDETERFRRFIPEERDRSRLSLSEAVREAIGDRAFWIAGIAEVPAGRLKSVAEAIFAQVYPQVLPFPFDGFATANGAGAADAAQLVRSLTSGQVDGHWVMSQAKRLQNRASSVLANSWRALPSNGQLTAPSEPKVKTVYAWLQRSHRDEPTKTLWTSYRALIAPPYGMNASSAGLLLGLLIGSSNPPCRIEQRGEMVASSDWVASAVHPQKHFFKREILENTTLRFLSENAETRWRSLLERWESEENYQKKVDISQEAERLRRADPLPEVLEGRYCYLRDESEKAAKQLLIALSQRNEWERELEKADRQNDVGILLRIGSHLVKQRAEMEDNPHWSQTDVDACDQLLEPLRNMVSALINDWIPRQSCNSVPKVGEFRHRMEKACASLKDLGFRRESEVLEQQSYRAIHQVEQRQRFSLTLDESDDYPRQPAPTESTPVKDLRNSIEQGERLIEAIKKAATALSEEEIAARINAIKRRQSNLKDMLVRQRNALSQLYGVKIESNAALQDTLLKVRRLREIFVETSDANEINDLVVQLERIQTDIAAWERDLNNNPEHLSDLLQQHIMHQLDDIQALLEEKEIDPAWDLMGIYQSIAQERVHVQKRLSAEWLKPRLALATEVLKLDAKRCDLLARELAAAPEYLSNDDRQQAEKLLREVNERIAELAEQHRHEQASKWLQRYLALSESKIASLDRFETEQYLKELRNPPVDLVHEERTDVEPILTRLMTHLDHISMDEILGRIERLPIEQQRQLLSILCDRLAA